MPDYVNKTLTFKFKGKQYHVKADVDEWKIPLLSHILGKRIMKKSISSYLIFARERNVSSFEYSLSPLEPSRRISLNNTRIISLIQ